MKDVLLIGDAIETSAPRSMAGRGWMRLPTGEVIYRAQRGDSLQGLAHRYLGSGMRFPEIASVQPKLSGSLAIGDIVTMPPQAVATAEKLGLVPAAISPEPPPPDHLDPLAGSSFAGIPLSTISAVANVVFVGLAMYKVAKWARKKRWI